jgi:iron(III) transport system ATP-binding protein
MSRNGPASVEFRHVTKRYGQVVAVNDVSFTIEPGTLVTLLGPSGCGKTTTLRLIAGLEMANEGEIRIGGIDVTRLSASERDVSMVFQSYALFPHMSVLDNVAYGPSVSGVKKAEAREMAREKLGLVGLKGFDERLPSELSGGQQQRVAVARALVLEPQVLLFDEPLSNLDAKLRRRVREDIRELQRRLNLTVAYVTHDQQEALAVSDRIIVMSNAAIAQSGSPRDLYEAPVDLFVADFIGDANLVDAELTRDGGARARVRIGTVDLDLAHRDQASGACKVAIRPESILVHRAAPDTPSLAGSVAKAAYLGTHMEYSISTPVGELFVVDRQVTQPLAVGAPAWIGLADHGVTVVPR